MTGKERIFKAIRITEPDRVPVFPLAHYFSAVPGKISIRTYATQADKMAAALIAAVERFGWDGVHPGCDVSVEGEALGSRLDFPEDAPPHMVQPVLSDPENFRSLKKPNPLRDGRMPVVVRATEICAKEIGSETCVGPCLMGPFNCASQLRGVEDLMVDTIERPEFVEALLDFCTEVLVDYGKALMDAGAHVLILGEALCSPGMISPKYYARTIVPRQQRMVKALNGHNRDCRLFMHICGDIRPILSTVCETGVDAADIDWEVDMGQAKEVCAGRMAIRGNLDPSAVLLSGTPDQVYRKSVEIIRAAGAGGGLILGSGCDVAPVTPFENLDAMMAAAKDTAAR
jgi:uroporphyrinogen decarboxylase